MKYERLRVRGEHEILKGKEKNIQIEKKIERVMSDEEKWEIEYKNLSNNDQFYSALDLLKKCIYEFNGYVDTSGFRLPSNHLAFLDVNGLISFDERSRNLLAATNKGKYFLKKFIQEH